MEKNGILGIHSFLQCMCEMQKNALALASPKTRSPPQITDGFCGYTAKFYFDILKYCVSNSYNILSGKRNDEEDIRII